MADRYDDLFSFLEDDGLTIPHVASRAYPAGRAYIIPSPDAATGLRFAALADLGMKASKGIAVSDEDMARLHLDDAQEVEFAEQVLGTAYAEMRADGVSWVRMQRITQYAYTHFAVSPDAARNAAKAGLFSGKEIARPNRETRRAAEQTQARQDRQDSTDTRASHRG